MSSKKTHPNEVACADCESVGPPRTRLTGNRSRYGLTLGGAVLFGVGGVALAVAVVAERPGWDDPAPPWLVALRILAVVGLGVGGLLLFIRLMHATVGVCSSCGSTSVVPLDTPRGIAISGARPGSPEEVPESKNVPVRQPSTHERLRAVPLMIIVVLLVVAAAGIGLAGGYSAGRDRAYGDAVSHNYSSYPNQNSGYGASGAACKAEPNLESFPIQDRSSRDCVTRPGGVVVVGDMTQTVTSLERVRLFGDAPKICASVKIFAGSKMAYIRSANWSLRDPGGAESLPGWLSPSVGETVIMPRGSASLQYCFEDRGLGGTYLVVDPPSRMAWRSIWVFELPAP